MRHDCMPTKESAGDSLDRPGPDVEPTAEAIDQAAEVLERAAAELRRRSNRMRQDGDITHAAEAMSTVQNIIPQMRLDLFVTRPLRALQRL